MQSGISSIKRCRLEEGASSAGPESQLPEDVVIEILARLPVKFLIRFKCVCKRWFSLIGTNHLAAKQLAAGRSSDDDHHDCLLSGFSRGIDDGRLQFYLHSVPSGTHSLRRFKINPGSIRIAIAEPLDGILCLKVHDEDIRGLFVLWNPITGEAKSIPPPTKRVQVYSLGSSSSWRVLDVSYFFDGSRWIDVANYSHMRPSMTLSADGRMLSMVGRYKLLGNNGSDAAAFSVVSFDLSDEIYIETPFPPLRPSPDHTDMHRLLCHCLNLSATCTLIFNVYQVRLMEIWDLIGCGASGSWTKRICVDIAVPLYRTFVCYKESLVSIPKISVKEGDCIESDPYFSIDEENPFSIDEDNPRCRRTLFTFQLPRINA
ncbi:hypothetical protein Dimus_032530 [Dionaea muscipula]